MSAIHVRPAMIEDMFQVVLIKNIAWVYAYKGIMSDAFLFERTNASAMKKTIEKWGHGVAAALAGHVFLVAENEAGEIVGFVFGGAVSKPELTTDKELYALYVHPAVHGLGVGRQLIRAFAQYVVQTGGQTFSVGCLSANKSLAFYKHLGGTVLFEINNPHFENLPETFLGFDVDKVIE